MKSCSGMNVPRFFRASPAAEKDILQEIVLRAETMHGSEPLYLRARTLPGGGMRRDTDSFVNLFHKERWEKLTGLRHPALEVTCRGDGRLLLMTAKGSAGSRDRETPFREAARLEVRAEDGPATFRVLLPEDQAFCSFAWEEDRPGALRIERTCYAEAGSSEEADGNVRLALIIATWRRPAEVSRLAEIYRAACEHRHDFARHAHLFVVNNDTSAQETFPLRSSANLTVLHSHANIGGAGAFALGARTALARGGFSHVVFMDDDIVIQEETWFRTLSLVRRLKAPYSEQIVSGAMLTQEKPCFCHAFQEALDESGQAHMLAGRRDIGNPEDVLSLLAGIRTEIPGEAEAGGIRLYAAWWYCVLPAGLIVEKGFPLPLFFRGDDQEFGLRSGRMTLPLNGIFVWHPDFEHKKSLLRLYLGFRNGAVTALLHLPDWRGIVFRRLLLNAWRELVSGRHCACALRILALHDFMHFQRLPMDGDRLTERLGKWLSHFREGRRPSPHNEPETCPFTPARTARLAVLVLLSAWRLWLFDADKAHQKFKKLMRQQISAAAFLSPLSGRRVVPSFFLHQKDE